MDIKALDHALQEIVSQKAELSKLDYSNPKYDDLEEKLHDLEDDFQDEYGGYLEEAIQKIHDKFCPDNDVLLPIAYLGDGAVIDLEKLPGREAKLMLAANPTRLVLKIGKDKQETVWTAQ
jgi:hypothetical protein